MEPGRWLVLDSVPLPVRVLDPVKEAEPAEDAIDARCCGGKDSVDILGGRRGPDELADDDGSGRGPGDSVSVVTAGAANTLSSVSDNGLRLLEFGTRRRDRLPPTGTRGGSLDDEGKAAGGGGIGAGEPTSLAPPPMLNEYAHDARREGADDAVAAGVSGAVKGLRSGGSI